MAKKTVKSEKKNLFDVITDRIIAKLEEGVVPWRATWINYNSTNSNECAISRQTGKPYSLINQMLLEQPGEYLTFKQAAALGGHVKKGAKGKTVVFWKMIARTSKDENGEESTSRVPVLKHYTVFHLDDCEGIEPKYAEPVDEVGNTDDPDEVADAVVQAYVTGADVKLRLYGNRAYYTPGSDRITVPKAEKFESVNAFYATLFHEMTHSTGAENRLNRPEVAKATKFGSKPYSREELVAEMGATALMNTMGLETEGTFDNSASYIEGWLTTLKEDNHAIVVAAGKAQKAIELIMSYSTPEEAEAEDDGEVEIAG